MYIWGRPPKGPGGGACTALGLAAAGAVRRWAQGREGGGELGKGTHTHTNTRQSPNILNKNQTYSTKVIAKTDETKPQETIQSSGILDKALEYSTRVSTNVNNCYLTYNMKCSLFKMICITNKI